MKKARKLGLGLALLAASLGAGIGLASAQTDTTPPTTEAPVTAERDGDCPEKDGATGSSTSPSTDATATNAIRLARRG